MTTPRRVKLLRIAALLAILGLILMVWAVLVPTPLPVVLAMTAGQGAGTLSFLLYLLVVIADLRRAKILDEPPPAEAPPS